MDENKNYENFSENNSQWSLENYDLSPQKTKKEKNGKKLKIFSIIITILFVITAASFAGFILYQNKADSPLTEVSEESAEHSDLNISLNNRPSPEDAEYKDGVLSTEEISARVRPSVVGVVTYDFGATLTATGAGSGIIMSDDGYILTNAHVVSGANGILVVLSNEEEHEATLVGIDEKTDIAVLKIEATDLVKATFGNSDELVVGERIIAIGNPTGLNLAGSTTQGIVSGLQRTITLESNNGTISMEVIQVDAAINPGNSGGALINKYGQVVGINSSKLASTQIEGIGFAIPINTAKPIIDDLISYGYVKGRVRLGISYSPISDVVGAMSGYTPGLLIRDIDQTADVYKKGLRIGDVITKIDGKDVRSTEDTQQALEGKNPGDTVKLSVFRTSVTGKTSSFTAEVLLSEDKGSLSNQTQETEPQQNQTVPFDFFDFLR